MASIIEFLNEVDLENITCQVLHESITGAATRKSGGTEVKFMTKEIVPYDIYGKMRRTAIIVWMDAEEFDSALKKLQGK